MRFSSGAANPESDVAASMQHRQDAARIPVEEFLRDWSNVVRGTVTGPDGVPVAGAEVEVFAKSELLEGVRAAEPTQPQARLVTDERGQFAVTGLSYGTKYVRARAAGHREHVIEDVASLDGVGAQGLALSLEPATEWNVVLENDHGETLRDEPVTLVPEGLIDPASATRSDAEGRVSLPESLRGELGSGVWMLIGKPATTRLVSLADERITLPPVSPLRLQVEGVDPSEPVVVRLMPRTSPLLGAHSVTVSASSSSQWFTVEGVRNGAYGVAVEQQAKAAWLEIEHDGEPVSCRLADRWNTTVRIVGADGDTVQSPVQWRWQPGRPAYPRTAAADRRALLDQVDAATLEGQIESGGEVTLAGLIPTGGWFSIQSRGLGRRLVQLEQGEASQTVVLRGEWITVISPSPYLPVHVETADGWMATYEADRFSEVAFVLPPGPYVVRSRFSRGSLSRPRGGWVGRDADPIRFNLTDAVDDAAGQTLFGFVTAGEQPVAGAEVFLSQDRTTLEVADDHGFFRFDAPKSGYGSLSARRPDDADQVLWPMVADIAAAADVRADLEIAGGAIDFRACLDELEGELVALDFRPAAEAGRARDAAVGAERASVAVRQAARTVIEGSVRFGALWPGAYEVWHQPDSGETRLLRRFHIAGGEQLVVDADGVAERRHDDAR